VLALEDRCEPFTLGRGIELEKVREIDALAAQDGFELADMRAFDLPISREAIARTRAAADERRAASA